MMKKIIFFAFILFAFTACEKDDPDTDFTPYVEPKNTGGGGGGGNQGSSSMTASIDGQNFTSVTTNGVEMSGQISITGNGSNNQLMLQLIFPNTLTPGNHNYDGMTIVGGLTNISTSTSYYAENGPLLEITSINTTNKTVSGKFNFTAYNVTDLTDSISVSNGNFSASYQ